QPADRRPAAGRGAATGAGGAARQGLRLPGRFLAGRPEDVARDLAGGPPAWSVGAHAVPRPRRAGDPGRTNPAGGEATGLLAVARPEAPCLRPAGSGAARPGRMAGPAARTVSA